MSISLARLLNGCFIGLLALVFSCGGGGSGNSMNPPAGQPSPNSDDLEKPSLADLQMALNEEFERLGIDPSRVAAKVTTDAAVFDLAVVVNDADGAGGEPPVVELSWTERMLGDYDQNGLVGISDLTPLGVRFGEDVAYEDPVLHDGFEAYPSGDPDEDLDTPPGQPLPQIAGADNWRRARIDGDANGEINIAEITPIAVHFNEMLSGYRIYRRADDETEFTLLPMPEDSEAPLTIARSATFPEGASGPDANRPVRYHFNESPENGNYEYYVAPYDSGSNEEGDPSSTVEVEVNHEIIDPGNLPPIALLSATPSSGRIAVDALLDASLSSDPDGTIVEYQWDYENDGTVDETTTVPQINHLYNTAGIHPARVRVVDNDGAAAEYVTPVEVIANIAPLAMISADVSTGLPGLELELSASGSSDEDGTIAKFEWDWDSDGVFDFDSATVNVVSHVYPVSGNYFPAVRVTDNEGGFGTASVTEEIVVNLGPSPALTADVTLGGDPLVVTFDASASSDPDGEVTWYEWDWDGNGTRDAQGGNPSPVHIFYDPGIYSTMLRVTDDDGAVSEWSEALVITVLDAPDAQLSADPLVGDPPLLVSFDASASSDNGTIEKFEWDFDGDGLYDEDTGNVPLTSHEYTERGVFYARVQVTDNEGLVSTDFVEIRVRLFPTASLVATPLSGPAPLNVSLDASGSEPGSSPILRYDWDYDGDGTIDESTSPDVNVVQHIYAQAGYYTPTVTVVDEDDGFDSASQSVTATGWRIQKVDSGTGSYNSLVLVNGNPALSYHGASSGLWYRRALDPLGLEWGSGVNIDNVSGFSGRHSKLAVVNGNPAIGYYEEDWGPDPQNGIERAKYARATDEDGATWGEPVVVEDSLGDWSSSTALTVAGGNPAMAYIKAGNLVRYCRADNAEGSDWGTPDTVADFGETRIWSLDMEIVNGNPAIAAAQNYYRATDAIGSDWNSAVGAGTNRFNRLVVIAGEPKLVAGLPISNSDRFTFRFSYSTNANGTSWQQTAPEGGSFQIGNYPGLGSYDGLPVYGVVGRETGVLSLRQATNADGSAWGTHENVVSGIDGLSGHIQILEVSGHRSFTYFDESSGPGTGGRKLMYGVYIN